jgi:type II secretory pathway pseudopilin PulG
MKSFFPTTPHNHEAGFTLVETLIAILILAMTIGALLNLTAGGFFTIRYAKNDIVANNLLQESLEYIHNNRDSASQQGLTWDAWKSGFNACFAPSGCMINPYARDTNQIITKCLTDCDNLVFYKGSNFYSYPVDNYIGQGEDTLVTSFVRTITMAPGLDPDQVVVTAKMSWMNGTNKKTITQSIIIAKWNLQ